MTSATIEIKRWHQNCFDVFGYNDGEKGLSQCAMIVLLANRLMATMTHGCKDGDDIEIIITRFGKEENDE